MSNTWIEYDHLEEATDFIGRYCLTRALLGGQYKTKWDTLRFYARFGNLSLHSIIYPGYVYNQFPTWLWKIDIYVVTPVLQFFFEKLFVKWQMFIYRRAYKIAIQRWPLIRKNILCCADYSELLEGL